MADPVASSGSQRPIYEVAPSAFMQKAPESAFGKAKLYAKSMLGGLLQGADNNYNFLAGGVQAPVAAAVGLPALGLGKALNTAGEAVGYGPVSPELEAAGRYLTDQAASSANRAISGATNIDGDDIESATGGFLPEFQKDFERRNNYGTADEQASRERLQTVADLGANVLPFAPLGTGLKSPALLNRAGNAVTRNIARNIPQGVKNFGTRSGQRLADTARRLFPGGQSVVSDGQKAVGIAREGLANLANTRGLRTLGAIDAGATFGGVLPEITRGAIEDARQTSELRNYVDKVMANREQPNPTGYQLPQLDFQSVPESNPRAGYQLPQLDFQSVPESNPRTEMELTAPTNSRPTTDEPTSPSDIPAAQPQPTASARTRPEPDARKGGQPAATGTPPASSPMTFFQKELRQYADRTGAPIDPQRYKLEPAQAAPTTRTRRPAVATPPTSNPSMSNPGGIPSVASANAMNQRAQDLYNRVSAGSLDTYENMPGGNKSLYTNTSGFDAAPQLPAAPSAASLAKRPGRSEYDRANLYASSGRRAGDLRLDNQYAQRQAAQQARNDSFLNAGNAVRSGNTSTGVSSVGGKYTRTIDPTTGRRKVVSSPLIGMRGRQAGITPENANSYGARNRAQVLASNSRARRNANPQFQAYRQRRANRRANALSTRRAMRFGR